MGSEARPSKRKRTQPSQWWTTVPEHDTREESRIKPVFDSKGGTHTSQKKRLSAAERLAAEALALTNTEAYTKGKKRLSGAARGALVPTGDAHEHDRQVIPRIQSKKSSNNDHPGIENSPASYPDTDVRDTSTAKRGTKLGRSQQRIGIDNTDSKTTGTPSDPNRLANSTSTKRSKAGRSIASTEQPRKPNEAPRSKKTVPLETQESFGVSKKTSKRRRHEEPEAHEHVDIDKTEPTKRRTIESHRVVQIAEQALPYRRLKATTRRVSRETISVKWMPLPVDCVQHISQLLQDLQKQVVVRHSDERKRTQSGTALQWVSRKLISKLSKGLPFPQEGHSHRENDFDFEKILDHNRALEAQLSPSIHANELLKAKLVEQTALLDSRKQVLAELNANTKSEAAFRTGAARKVHPLIQTQGEKLKIEQLSDGFGLRIGPVSQPLESRIQIDGQLESVVQDVLVHTDSIQGNVRQVDGIAQAISKTIAAVQATLFDRASDELYQDVVLGVE